MMDLQTTYLGLSLPNPLVASASPLGQDIDAVKALADAGCSALVMNSMFEEVIRRQEVVDSVLADTARRIFGSSADVGEDGDAPTESYLRQIERAANAVDIPIIGALNGATPGFWVQSAQRMIDAGAAAIELNIYALPALDIAGADVEEYHLELLTLLKHSVNVPIAVKLSPYFSSFGAMALALDQAGADGLVLFNRFLQPDIDIEAITVTPRISLSSSSERLLPQTWIALLRGQVRASLAATSGVETADDVISYLLAGADVVMTASAMLRNGPGHAAVLLDGLRDWMSRKGFDSIDEVRGRLAVGESIDRGDYDRYSYVTALQQEQIRYRQPS